MSCRPIKRCFFNSILFYYCCMCILLQTMSTTIDAFSLNTGPIDEGTRALAEAELRETPERVAEACQRLRELLHADKTIYFRDDDEFLLIFLRPCKFYPESAHALVSLIVLS